MKKTIFLSLLYLFILPQKINAQVIISEIYPSPTSEEKEWVELYNTGSTEINLNGYKLEDTLSSPSVLYTFTEQIIAPNSFYFHELATAKLNNVEDSVKLFDSNNQQIDQFDYKNAEQKQSFSRMLPLTNFSGQKSTPTPNLANNDWHTLANDSTDNNKLVLNKNVNILSPIACENQISLFNQNSMSFDLKNYQLKIDQNLVESTNPIVKSQQSYDITINTNLLNSIGGNIFLLKPNGELEYETNYPPCQAIVNANQDKDSQPESETLLANTTNNTDETSEVKDTSQNLALKEQIDKEKELLKQKIIDYYNNQNKVDLPSTSLSIPHFKVIPAKKYIDVIEIPYKAIINVIIGGLLITTSAFVAINHEEKIKFETIS